MNKLGILTLLGLALAIPVGAQNGSSNGSGASVQAQANANASANASANTPQQQSKQAPPQKQSSEKSAGSSASGAASSSSSASASAAGNSVNLSNDTAVQATLLTALDAKHSKPGDKVVAKTTQDVKQDGQVVLRKGTKLTGHVTEAQARSKENSQSTLGVVFDSALMKGSQQAPMHLGIQALAAASNQTSAALADDGGMVASGGSMAGSGRAAGGGLLGGAGATAGGVVGGAGNVAGNVGQSVNGTVGATARTAGSGAGNAGGLNAAGQLTSTSTGVFGLQGLNLTSAASNVTQGSAVVSSSNRNVHLDSGTQMVLRAEAVRQ